MMFLGVIGRWGSKQGQSRPGQAAQVRPCAAAEIGRAHPGRARDSLRPGNRPTSGGVTGAREPKIARPVAG
jgi:hypothetical protein